LPCSAATFRLAGLVDAYAAACRTVANILQVSNPAAQQQQQQKQQQQQYGVAQVNAAQHTDVTNWLLNTWEVLVGCWPAEDGTASPLSASACIAAAAPAFVSLASAVLRDPTADSNKKGLAVFTTKSLCSCLELEYMEAAAATGAANQHQTLLSSTDVGRQMMQSEELPMLLAVCSAVCAQQAYTSANGKAGGFTASQNSAAAAAADAAADAAVAVPKFHSNLLRDLQVTGTVKLPEIVDNGRLLKFMLICCRTLQHLMVSTMYSAGQVGSSSSSSATAGAAAAALPLSLVEPWVLTFAELVLLLRPEYKEMPLSAADTILQAARDVAACGGYGLAGKAALDSCKGRLIKPLMQQLLPDVWQALKGSKMWKSAERSSSRVCVDGIVEKDNWPLVLERGLTILVVMVDGGECTGSHTRLHVKLNT
jgi:hypothetical protein